MSASESIFWAMSLLLALSVVYPWRPTWPMASLLVHLPWLLLPLWFAYEVLMPPGMNIRLDLPLIYGGLIVAFAIYAVRLLLFALVRRRGGTHPSPTR